MVEVVDAHGARAGKPLLVRYDLVAAARRA